jgi:protocatechuate 3,4-dioxygenase beta subunit
MTPNWKSALKKFRTPRKPTPARRLHVERLEDRWNPAFMLRLEQAGFAPLTLVDNGPGDGSPVLGNVQFIGSYGTFNFNVTAVQTKPLTPNTNAGEMDFNTFSMSSTAGGTLLMTAADTDYNVPSVDSNPLTLQTQIGGTLSAQAGSSVTFQSHANPDNLSPFDTPTTTIPAGSVTPGPAGPFAPGAYNSTISTSFNRNATPYSIFVQATLVLNGAGSLGFNAFTDVTAPPKPKINIVKLTNGTDNDTAPGLFVPVGGPVAWTYAVTNPGNEPVKNVVVTDDNGTPGNAADDFAPTFLGGDANNDNLLDPTETWTYSKTGGIAVAGQYTNNAVVTGAGNTSNIPVTDDNPDNYFGYLPVRVGDFVWDDLNADGDQDAGEPGIAGVRLDLTGTDVNGNPVAKNTTTDADGLYLFDNLAPGTYTVAVTNPGGGYIATIPLAGGNTAKDSNPTPTGTTPAFLPSGAEDRTLDFGFYQFAALGDFVWNDLNANGQQDGGEPGIPGVPVNLTGTDGQGNFVTGTTTTDADGKYLFPDLVPGTYQVSFPTLPGFVRTGANVGNDATDSDADDLTLGVTGNYTLVSGQTDLTVDAGYYQLVKVGDFVWDDTNANGIQDGGEPGINGVTLTLTGTTGAGAAVTLKTTTAGNGGYLFDNLVPGTYTVAVDAGNFAGAGALVGYLASPTGAGGNPALDSNPSPTGTTPAALPGGSQDLTLDFGFYKTVRVGNFVWHDVNANGRQDAGEPGIGGVELKLYDANDNLVGTDTTDADGLYLFDGLKPGAYTVKIQTALPTGYDKASPTAAFVPVPFGTDVDSNESPTTTAFLPGGTEDLTRDFGYYKLAALGDFVWSDKNANGVQDAGELGIPNVTVNLKDAGGAVIATTTTDANGLYLFPGLTPGTYSVQFPTLPGLFRSPTDVGANDAKDSDALVATGMTGTYTLASGETNLTVDAGYYTIAIELVKLTNGTDNNNPTGPVVPVGSTVTFTYIVTNTGNAPLTDVEVVDDNGTQGNTADDFVVGTIANLASGASATLTAARIATAGQYVNYATVTGKDKNDGTNTVTDTDLDHHFGATPTINIVKLTNSTDNDTAPGLLVPVGTPITWTYTVTAVGANEPIANVVVVDDAGTPGVTSDDFFPTYVSGDANGNKLLDPTETWTYTAAGGLAVAGQYTNNAVVAGKGSISNIPVTDDNPDNYFGLTPRIDVEKTTDGSPNGNPVDSDYDNEDAANGPGVPVLTPGTVVTWTYKVKNTGTVPFDKADITLVDDNGTAATSDDLSIANGKITFAAYLTGDADNLLEPGEEWTYTASGIVQNLATPGGASTVDFSGSSATSGAVGNIRNYTVGGVGVNVSAFSRDKATGAWETAYLGAYAGGLGVTDGIEGTGANDTHTVDNVGRDNYVLFEFSETVVVDSAFLGYVVNDSDLTVWIGTLPDAFNNHTVLSDAVLAGLGFTEVNLTTLTGARLADLNAGNVAGNVLVIAADTTDTSPEDRFKIEKLTVKKVQPGTYENKATVTAPNADPDSDLSHYKNPTAKINIEKYVKEVTVTGGEGLTPGYWKQTHHFPTWGPTGYAPANSFNTVFGVSDPDNPTLLQALQTGGGGFNALGRHAVAALLNSAHPTVEYKFTTAQVIAKVQSAYANPSLVESIKNELAAENERGADLSSDTGSVTDPTPGNPGSDADAPTGLVLQTGEYVLFTFVVTNPGATPLANVVVTDDNQTPNDPSDDFNPTPVLAGGFNVGDADKDNVLDVGEAWKYTYGPIVVTEGQHTNNATVTGTPVGGGPAVTDNDPANWFGITDKDGTIKGKKFLDASGNGLNLVAGTHSPADTPMAGVTIYIDADNDGVKDAGEHATVTAADGGYQFTGLTPGTYIVREVVPAGYVRTGPATADYYAITIASGQVLGGYDFANAEKCEEDTITNLSFTIVSTDGTTRTVTDLRGNTREGDLITATFKVNVPAGQTHLVSFVSYTAPEPYFNANTAHLQRIDDLAQGEFGPGTHSLTIRVPNCFYQVDLVCGDAIDKLGPAGSNIFYTPQGRLESADNGGEHACGTNPGTISGYKWLDKDADGVWDAGEPGLKDWTIYVDANNNNVKDAGELATVTDANGFYRFNNVPAGSYSVREVLKAGWFQSKAPGTVTLTAGENETNENFGNYQKATVSGYKYDDKNADGEWDKDGLDNCLGTADDEKGLSNWRIFVDLDGDEVWDTNEPSDLTDSSGYYSISGITPGAIQIREVCQSGWVRTTDDADMNVTSGQSVSSVNVGNFKGNLVMDGDTATVNFWKGTVGQALIKKMNGSVNSTALGNWLASNFPNVYGSGTGSNNMAGKKNWEVADYMKALAADSTKQLQANVLATVFAVYVTDTDWAGGSYAASYGFNVSTTGVKNDYFNIGTSGAAFGVQDDSILTVWQILQATNARASGGVLWSGYSSAIKTKALWVFVGINGEGGI